MRQDISKDATNNLKKKYQISFRRWITCKSGGNTVAPYIGESRAFVREWISDRLISGMNWSNYGDVWVIDHIVPLRLFNLSNKDELRVAFHYKNTMPLFKEDNLYKEGAIEFSFKMLQQLPDCEIKSALFEYIKQDESRLDKYLIRAPEPLQYLLS